MHEIKALMDRLIREALSGDVQTMEATRAELELMISRRYIDLTPAEVNKERLLNVAKALRESKNPQSFSMGSYTQCGTPGCALGHYAARSDLQHEFVLSTSDGVNCPLEDSVETDDRGRIKVGAGLTCNAQAICDHFGLDKEQTREIFNASGCGMATTARDAARYIEDFVDSHC